MARIRTDVFAFIYSCSYNFQAVEFRGKLKNVNMCYNHFWQLRLEIRIYSRPSKIAKVIKKTKKLGFLIALF